MKADPKLAASLENMALSMTPPEGALEAGALVEAQQAKNKAAAAALAEAARADFGEMVAALEADIKKADAEAPAKVVEMLEHASGAGAPFAMQCLQGVLEQTAHKKSGAMRNACEAAVVAMTERIPATAVPAMVQVLYGALKSSKWQPQKVALQAFETLAKTHTDVIASILADVVPPVSDLMASSKPAVQDAAKAATLAAVTLNPDPDPDPSLVALTPTLRSSPVHGEADPPASL